MIQFDEALRIVEESAYVVETERVGLLDSLNRVLAEDIKSDMQMPPFNKSAVDGYACRKTDLTEELEVIEVIKAGQTPKRTIGEKQCSKIMTGAPLPEGADAVIMVEDMEELDNNKIKNLKETVKNNICYIGEDIKEGQLMLEKGALIQPQHIAVLATVGATNPLVYKRVKVAVISTGDELVEPFEKPTVSKIRNSNAYQLIAQAQKMGALTDYIGIALDTEESTREKITQAFKNNDVVLLTGGVSMGDFDFVPQVLNELGVDIKFKSVAVQPGRPTVFGVRGKQFIFGLPGNPVSSFVLFELVVKHFIYRMLGRDNVPLKIALPLGVDYSRKISSRLSWLPVKIDEDGNVIPIDYHGSAHINALTLADGLISMPIGVTELKKGDLVNVRQI
jgi:molybdopterin molybdotransferase